MDCFALREASNYIWNTLITISRKISGSSTTILSPNRKDHEKAEFEVHEVYAVDVLISTGEGKACNNHTFMNDTWHFKSVLHGCNAVDLIVYFSHCRDKWTFNLYDFTNRQETVARGQPSTNGTPVSSMGWKWRPQECSSVRWRDVLTPCPSLLGGQQHYCLASNWLNQEVHLNWIFCSLMNEAGVFDVHFDSWCENNAVDFWWRVCSIFVSSHENARIMI